MEAIVESRGLHPPVAFRHSRCNAFVRARQVLKKGMAMKRFLVLTLVLSGIAFAVDPDGFDGGGFQAPVQSAGSNDITITILNTWQAGYASHVLGLDYRPSDGVLLFISSSDNKIFIADPDDGSYIGEVARPAGITGFGVAWDGSEYYVNSWNQSVIYHSDGAGSWASYSNPAGTGGRGLLFDDFGSAVLLEAYSSDPTYQAMSFNPDGSGFEAFDLEGIPGQLSGIAGHPMVTSSGDRAPVGLIATCYNFANFYFYMWNGTGYTLYDTEPCPTSVTKSFGLTFTDLSRGTFFWSYQGTDGLYYVAELQIDVLGALEPETWGAIKSLF
jgi:hypothetical protein